MMSGKSKKGIFGSICAVTVGILGISACYPPHQKTMPQVSQQTLFRGLMQMSLNIADIQRHFIVYLPRQYNREIAWPVVVIFHGGGSHALLEIEHSGWIEQAEKAGFIAVFPEGTRPDPSRPARFLRNPQTWNDGSSRSNIGAANRGASDMLFVDAMIETLQEQFSVDPRRIYATGFSNGASMSFRLARERSKRIAAIAPVAGNDWRIEIMPTRAVPILYISGAADPLNPIAGGKVKIGLKSFGDKPPISETINRWVKIHQCPQLPDFNKALSQFGTLVYQCEHQNGAVVVHLLEGHGHYWPGASNLLPERIAGEYHTHMQAPEVIWQFFRHYQLPRE